MSEYGSFSKEVSEILNVNANTLRRWSLELEKNDYNFERNEKEQRIYYKRDVVALRKLQKLLSEKTPGVNAFKAIADEHNNNLELEQTLGVHDQNSVQIAFTHEQLQALIDQSVERAIEKEREVLLDAIEEKMSNVIERRDRQLVAELNESMEQKRLELAAAEETKRWWEFWKQTK